MQEVVFFGAAFLAEVPGRPLIRILTQTAPTFLHVPEGASFEEIFDRSREMALILKENTAEHTRPDREAAPRRFDGDLNEEVENLLDAFEQYDGPVLLRGLYKALIAYEMRRFPHLLEEMALSAIISREAALELLRRKLSTKTGKRLKKGDVLDMIRREFPTGEPYADCLEGDWENRLIMVHPVSTMGEWWSPMMEYEECTDTLHHLVHLYRYLLLDEIWDPET